MNTNAKRLWELLSMTSPDDVPPGFKTARQWAAEFGVSTDSVQKRFCGNPKVEAKPFKITCGGRLQQIPHYKLKVK